MSSDNDIRAQRVAKLEAFRAAGVNPFPEKPFASEPIAEALKKPEGASASVAGRMVLFREMGNITFFHIQDRTGRMQMVLNKRTYVPTNPATDYKFWLKKLDLGDIVHVVGERVKTNSGEESLMVKELSLVSKALLPIPEKWHGLVNEDQIYRQRYLDLISNRESFERFKLRSKMIGAIREYLNGLGFLELETPVLQAIEGGAAAKPFVTHYKALDADFYLRIAPELYLKRALVGGFEKVYEIGKNYRNEGLSRKHNPEYTGFEIYQAYSDMYGMMEIWKGMLAHLCENVFHKWQFKRPEITLADGTKTGGEVIDFSLGWKQIRYKDIVRERTKEHLNGGDWFTLSKEEKIKAARALGCDVSEKMEDFEVTQEFYSKKIEPTIMQPTFVTHFPRELCPLAKLNAEDPTLVDIFECAIAGMELGPSYTELNDPILQREILLKQVGEEVYRFDEDFITSLEHGMPSAGGMGVGLDRLVMILTEAQNIRDVILFPTLKPQS
jgi:lysyl-tRNA synthetase class 2